MRRGNPLAASSSTAANIPLRDRRRYLGGGGIARRSQGLRLVSQGNGEHLIDPFDGFDFKVALDVVVDLCDIFLFLDVVVLGIDCCSLC
jgi:hypothetical protein